MRKAWLWPPFILIFLLLPVAPSIAIEKCNPNDMHDVDPYAEFNFTPHHRKAIFAEPRSVSFAHPKILQEAIDLRTPFKNVKGFQTDFLRLHEKEATRDDVHDFFINRINLFEKRGLALAEKIKELNAIAGIQVEERIKQKVLGWGRRMHTIDRMADIDEAYKAYDFINLDFGASLIELSAFVSIKHAVYWGSKIEFIPELRALIESKLDFLLEKAEDHPAVLSALKAEFYFLKVNGQADSLDNLSAAQFVDVLKKWIFSKELDVLTLESDGKMRWVEVKMFSLTLDANRLMQMKDGKKSIYDQLKEDISLISILGLSSVIEVNFVGNNAIDGEVEAILRRLKVKYLH